MKCRDCINGTPITDGRWLQCHATVPFWAAVREMSVLTDSEVNCDAFKASKRGTAVIISGYEGKCADCGKEIHGETAVKITTVKVRKAQDSGIITEEQRTEEVVCLGCF